jgi:predicted nuclease of predicted toxin-antitoxin system
VRFIVDAQLPPALARLLVAHGYQAEHVAVVGLRNADDSPIWTYALQNGAAIITKDEDFPHRLSQSIASAPVIVWLRVGNTSRKALLRWFEPLLPQIVQLIDQGDRLIEVR